MLPIILILAPAAEPQFTVVNKTTPTFTVVSKIAPPKTDPYKMEYKAFYEWIASGGRGVLVVGIPDRYVGSYETHCWVPSGFAGLKDGEYDCFGKNEMTPRKSASVPEVTPPIPFPAGIAPGTTVRPAGVRSTPFLDTTGTELITILALPAARYGVTSCPPSG